jgi:hypothetical protein
MSAPTTNHKGLLSTLSDWINRYRDVYVEAQLRVETGLRERLAEKDQIILALENDLAQARAKVERMELVLMPLSSHAGAAYAAALRPPKTLADMKQQNMVAVESSSWNAYLKKYMADESDKMSHEADSAQKGTDNGTHGV